MDLKNYSDVFFPQSALTRALPNSFSDCLKIKAPKLPIDVCLARAQHEKYITLSKALVPHVFEIPADENHPDCCFVEDTAIVVSKKAVITRLGALPRRGEEGPVREMLGKAGISSFYEIKAPGTVDGGDVLFTGRHILVGLSTRTNQEGADQLSRIFDDAFLVYTVPVRGTLHLKSIMTAIDPETLLVANNECGRASVDALLKGPLMEEAYQCVFVADPIAANVLSIGSALVIQDGFPDSEKVLLKLAQKKNREVIKLNMSELIKADAALTCCSILF